MLNGGRDQLGQKLKAWDLTRMQFHFGDCFSSIKEWDIPAFCIFGQAWQF
jgi:hypothetical protein